MKLKDSNKSFDEEVNEHLSSLLSRFKDLAPQKVYLSSWKGVDDILDNVSGVSVVSEVGKHLSGIQLVQLDCDNSYIELAKAIAEKAADRLISDGYLVYVKSSIN